MCRRRNIQQYRLPLSRTGDERPIHNEQLRRHVVARALALVLRDAARVVLHQRESEIGDHRVEILGQQHVAALEIWHAMRVLRTIVSVYVEQSENI